MATRPWKTATPQESLKAEYEAITGEAYKTQEEESAERAAVQRENKDAEYQSQMDADHARSSRIGQEPTASWTARCNSRRRLGSTSPRPTARTMYSSMEVAYRWIEDAGEDVVYVLPDGGMYYIGGVRKTISKTLRTGVAMPDVFARVLAVKEAYYAKLAARDEWAVRMRDD